MRSPLILSLLLILSFLLILPAPLFSQELPQAYRAYRAKYPEGPPLNRMDSLGLMSLPQKTLPEELRSDPLPPLVDNSNLPYLRPVFEQMGPSCGQAALVGYNFTYEIDYLRDLPAMFAMTQYPSHFTWNFQNGGNGWWGVSYFHSIEILRTCGCMNSFDYGDYYDDGRRWINGYNKYYNGMYNRIHGVYSIHTGTEEGILTLKHWLYNHLGEGNYGGVASYYSNTPWNAQILNDTTPEGGKHVMTAWFPAATHAMTIVGYNDSIRWDYNGDNRYTNSLDINGDGIIDPRDWEIGAVKFVNSHGVGAQDSGFCYMMYKCLAETFEEGGIWNQAVHILDVNENYQPLITYKVTLKHPYREKVKILAGVSQDTADLAPAWIMDFPIIDYQGADHYMQGQDTADYLKSLEFGLDITPLLSHLHPNLPAKFFFMADERDPFGESDGEITAFSVMDYTSGQQEIISAQTPLALENDSRTLASVIHTPDFDIVEITTDTLPVFTTGLPYSYPLEATGGIPPYSWSAHFNYLLEQSTDDFPLIDENQVLVYATVDSIVPVALGFSFPYYGEIYDTVYMHANGHLQFDSAQIPWPYMQEPELHFRYNRIITPMTNVGFTITPADGDGGWAETGDTSATFRWKLSWTANPGATEINIAVRLHQDGNIDFIYGNSSLEGAPWIGGISAGNAVDFIKAPFSGTNQIIPGTKFSFHYRPLPTQLSISENGLLTGIFENDELIYDISIQVTDQLGLTAVKTLQATSGPYLYLTVHPGGGDNLDYGDTVALDVEVRNGGLTAISNAVLTLATADPFLTLLDASCQPGTLLPGQSVIIPESLVFTVSKDIPDLRDLLMQAQLSASGQEWQRELVFRANAPDLQIRQVIVDNSDGILDPGETAPLMITLQNNGHAAIGGVNAGLVPGIPQVQVMGDPVQDFGTIGKGASVTRSYTLHADETAPPGIFAPLTLNISSVAGIQKQDTIRLRIGKTPVLVIDMDPGHHSGPYILNQLHGMNVLADYEYNISESIRYYQSLFICLGYHGTNHSLTLPEGQKLANYLDAGGKIYMEGRKAWKDDPGTPVHPKFNINWAGTATVFDTLFGKDATFAQGLKFVNGADIPFSFYHIEPIDPAFAFLMDNDNLKTCAVAYDAGTYKTIGAIFEHSTLENITPEANRNLMMKYLNFFDIDVNPVGLDPEKQTEENPQVFLYPNPASKIVTILSRQPLERIAVTDLSGRTMMIFSDIGSFPFTINISDLDDGLYFFRIINTKGETNSIKFLKIND
jgi:hypothetical protein